jgi:hypothetical protein
MASLLSPTDLFAAEDDAREAELLRELRRAYEGQCVTSVVSYGSNI